MKDSETDRLVAEMDELSPYNGWQFAYEFPGFFCYSHPDLPYRVAFTPDWEGDQELPIQVTDDAGLFYEEHSPVLPLPSDGRTGQQLLDLVRPTLDKLSTLPPPKSDDDTDQPCSHGDYRSCVVDDCKPLQLVHVPGVIVPPPARVACMWCGGDSERGQCAPCDALLDAIHAAPAAGIAAIVAATRSKDGLLDLFVRLTADEVAALKAAYEHVRVHMAHHYSWVVRDAAMIGLGKMLEAARAAEENH